MIFVVIDQDGVFVNRVVAAAASDVSLGAGESVVSDDPSLYTMPTPPPVQTRASFEFSADPATAKMQLELIAAQNFGRFGLP